MLLEYIIRPTEKNVKIIFPIRQKSLDKNKCSNYNTNTDRKRETEYRNPCPDRPVRELGDGYFLLQMGCISETCTWQARNV